MEKLWNSLISWLDMAGEVRRLRADFKDFLDRERKRDINDQIIFARLQAIADKLEYKDQLSEHKDQLQAVESRALKAELEAILLRFERRLPPSDS